MSVTFPAFLDTGGFMKIIISPAKKMDVNTDLFECSSLPAFLSEAGLLAHWVKTLSVLLENGKRIQKQAQEK